MKNKKPKFTYKPLPPGVGLMPSKIQGLGLHASRYIAPGHVFGISHRIHTDMTIWRTPLGGFINHSETPNAILQANGDCYYLVAIEIISPGDEITVTYTLEQDIENEEN